MCTSTGKKWVCSLNAWYYSYCTMTDCTSSTLFLHSLHDVVRPANVVHVLWLNIIIAVVGWIYFAAWSVSFYPQVMYITIAWTFLHLQHVMMTGAFVLFAVGVSQLLASKCHRPQL